MAKIFEAENGMNIVGQGAKIMLFTLPSVAAAIAAQRFAPGAAALPLPASVLRPVGFALLAAGAALWATALVQLLAGFPKGKLVTSGAYAVCRNPIYSSFAFFILPAIACLTGTWVYLGASAFLFLGVSIFIRREESQLRGVFGREYEAYTARVGRLVPFVKPRRRAA